MRATILFFYRDRYTDTALGQGKTETGMRIRSWSGLHVLDYLETETGKMPTLLCGPIEIPIT
ncbi:hypothetical protein C8N32_10877 [Rhodovulum imhoffii]|uniref:Uncharacterized protein n=1 Tax=Rhodovulum imhoffii TaxID=365340 RepID=A0A2T5BS55_9RHOB|nr:hypothetical protein [Rhodovulum imhoffii]MBK5934703.1 hypothetical protein [Rhodovulum imhoffii]PTN02126.1 hypothetical protein C8N32_10877 [Rhodovulum imhoffii]